MSLTPQSIFSINATNNLTSHYDPVIPNVLPPERMYTLQIGNKRFILSGASLSSDAPSYFTNFFLNAANSEKVLFIDRSPDVFKMIYCHLQGYYVEIPDADLFTRLFNDALYYNLPKLRSVLTNNEYYYVLVQGESFKFAKSLVAGKGNFPNFFTVSNDALYEDISNLIVDKNWIRPPPQAAPSVNRDLALLKQLITILQGVDVQIKDDYHRKNLIREAKYYRFFALVEKLKKLKIIWNPIRLAEEVIVSLEYLDHKSKFSLTQTPEGFYWSYGNLYGEDLSTRILIIQVEESGINVTTGNNAAIFEFSGNVMNKFNSLLRNFNRKVLGNANVVDFSTFSNVQNESNKPMYISIPQEEFKKSINDFEFVNESVVDNSDSNSTIDWKLMKCLLKFQFIGINQGERYIVKPEIIKAKIVVDLKDYYKQMEFL